MPLPENTHQNLQNGCQQFGEETPETTAEHSFKDSIFRSLGATEDHTVLNAQVTQDTESEDALKPSTDLLFPFYSFLLMHKNDV